MCGMPEKQIRRPDRMSLSKAIQRLERRHDQAEMRRSGDLGAPMNPLANVFGGPAGLLDELPDRLTEVRQ